MAAKPPGCLWFSCRRVTPEQQNSVSLTCDTSPTMNRTAWKLDKAPTSRHGGNGWDPSSGKEVSKVRTLYGVQTLVSQRQTTGLTTARGWELFLVSGQPGLQLADAAGWANYIAGGTDLRDGGWHHLAVTVDRDDPAGGALYVDGVEVLAFDPTGVAGSLTNTAPLRLGVHPRAHASKGQQTEEVVMVPAGIELFAAQAALLGCVALE